MAAPRKVLLASNAPKHWPQVRVGRLDPENPQQRAVAVVKALGEALEAKGLTSVLPVAGMTFRMFAKGFLEVPLEFTDAGRRVPIFIYPEATEEAARHFAAARDLLRESGGLSAVYYCPNPLPPARPGQALEPLDTRMFRSRVEGRVWAAGDSALWWRSPRQARFSTSSACESVTSAYQSMDGREPWLFMAFLNDLQLTKHPQMGPVALPERELMHPIHGPDGRLMLFCASAEKGISFAFPIATTPITYRDQLLKHYATFCREFAEQIRQQGLPDLPASDERPSAWWRSLVSVVQSSEAKGDRVDRVGGIEQE